MSNLLELLGVHIICVSFGVGQCSIILTIFSFCFSFRVLVGLFCVLEFLVIILSVDRRVLFVTFGLLLLYHRNFPNFLLESKVMNHFFLRSFYLYFISKKIFSLFDSFYGLRTYFSLRFSLRNFFFLVQVFKVYFNSCCLSHLYIYLYLLITLICS